MVDFTVAICTYNGEVRLPNVLDRLLSQAHTEHFSWEILVIDNNSTDSTASVSREYQSKSTNAISIRYSFEPRQGLAFARRRAIKEAKGSLIGFLDDDNFPMPDWVYAAYAFAQLHPKAGAFGSQIHGDYEINPPENFQKIACYLAIVERGQQPLRYDPRHWIFPAGAGLVVRKQVWLECVPERPSLKGVCGNCLASKGEDLETLSHIKKAGWEIWYNPNMEIYHQIPAQRLQKDYLLKLFKGVGLSRYPTRMLRFKAWQKPFVLPAYFANDLRKLIFYTVKHRNRFNVDLVAACELTLYWHSLISPFYHWTKHVLEWRDRVLKPERFTVSKNAIKSSYAIVIGKRHNGQWEDNK